MELTVTWVTLRADPSSYLHCFCITLNFINKLLFKPIMAAVNSYLWSFMFVSQLTNGIAKDVGPADERLSGTAACARINIYTNFLHFIIGGIYHRTYPTYRDTLIYCGGTQCRHWADATSSLVAQIFCPNTYMVNTVRCNAITYGLIISAIPVLPKDDNIWSYRRTLWLSSFRRLLYVYIIMEFPEN